MKSIKKLIPVKIKTLVRRILDPGKTPVKVYSRTKPTRGHVLFSYLAAPFRLQPDDLMLQRHAAYNRCREIAQVFLELGYHLDVIDWIDQQFVPKRRYDVVFDIGLNMARLESYYDAHTIKVVYFTTSNPYYNNAAEWARVDAVNHRRNGNYQPKRIIPNPQLAIRSLEIAESCFLIGNRHTQQTFPAAYHDKLQCIPIYARPLGGRIKLSHEFVPERREFLWFFGQGAVHKGLDLVLEVFARNPNLTLNVVGDVSLECDFMELYERELLHLPNICFHGFLLPTSELFTKILANTFAFVAPSCSESISAAVVDCMQTGLFPIVSRDTGVTLPDQCGVYLEHCTIDEIEQAVLAAYHMDSVLLVQQISEVQRQAQQLYSHDNWSAALKTGIVNILRQHDALG